MQGARYSVSRMEFRNVVFTCFAFVSEQLPICQKSGSYLTELESTEQTAAGVNCLFYTIFTFALTQYRTAKYQDGPGDLEGKHRLPQDQNGKHHRRKGLQIPAFSFSFRRKKTAARSALPIRVRSRTISKLLKSIKLAMTPFEPNNNRPEKYFKYALFLPNAI